MNRLMTLYANWNDIKKMLRLIAFVMMPFTGLVRAFAASEFCRPFKISIPNSITYCIMGLISIRIKAHIFFLAFFIVFAFSFSSCNCFSFWGFIVFFACPSMVPFACFAFLITCIIDLPFLGLIVLFTCFSVALSSFFALMPFVCTVLALVMIASFVALVSMKFRNWLNYFASRTSFRYDLLSHNQLLNSWFRLEPMETRISIGSHYYTAYLNFVNQITLKRQIIL